MKFLSIRTYLLLLIFTMTAIPLSIIAYDTHRQYRHNLDQSYLTLERLAHDIESAQKAHHTGFEQLMAMMEAVPALQRHDPTAANRLLARLVKKSPLLTNLMLVDTSGEIWASAVPFTRPASIADRRHFRNAMARGEYSSGEFVIGKILKRPVLNFAYPLKDESGAVFSVASVSFAVSNYNDLFRSRSHSPGTSLVLTDHQGTILYSSVGPEYTGRKDKLFREMLNTSDTRRFEAIGNSGTKRIHFWQPVRLNSEQTPYLYIRTGMASNALLNASNHRLLKNSSLLLLLLLTASGLTIYLNKAMVLDKIANLHQAMNRVANGDLSVRVADHVSGGELGALGNAFDSMTEQLNRDISERKLSEERLRQSEMQFAAIVNSTPDSININRLDDSVFININDGFTRMLGYSRNDVIGKPSRTAGIWTDPEARDQLIRQLHEHGQVNNFEARLRRKDGVIITALISSTLIEVNGTPCTLNIARDITERDQLLTELGKMNKLESLGVLAGGIAHDFNNILTGIMGNISLAKMHLNDPIRTRELLGNAEKASKRASELAKQLLVFSKGGKPIKKPLSVRMVLDDALSLTLTGTNIKGVADLPATLDIIEGDEGQLNQAFHNIIINAAQAMPGGGTLSVSGSNCELPAGNHLALPAGQYVALAFSDQGCGISEEDQKRIFDPYFSTKSGGSGLGLASTYAIIKNHGGQIAVTSSIGVGSTFTIYLPSTCLEPTGESVPGDAAEPPPGCGTVLVMDDEGLIRDLTTHMLSHFGYTVTTCSDGSEAVALYGSALQTGTPYAAVLMDLTIPAGIGGQEAARRILAVDPQACLVVSSGYADNPVMSNYREYGFAAAVEKPYTAQQLGDVMARVITSHRN